VDNLHAQRLEQVSWKVVNVTSEPEQSRIDASIDPVQLELSRQDVSGRISHTLAYHIDDNGVQELTGVYFGLSTRAGQRQIDDPLQEPVKIDSGLHVNKRHVELEVLHCVPGDDVVGLVGLAEETMAHFTGQMAEDLQNTELDLLVNVRVFQTGVLVEQIDGQLLAALAFVGDLERQGLVLDIVVAATARTATGLAHLQVVVEFVEDKRVVGL